MAHTYLSGCNEEVIVGNFMGDYVKGRNYMNFSGDIRKGILVHRDIDTFTDAHQFTRRGKQRLAPRYHKYAGIVIDIVYDHFLAALWEQYSTISLAEFVKRSYDLLKRNYQVLPDAVKRWFPTFLENNWMMAYQTLDGIELVLERMAANTSLPDHAAYAVEVLAGQYEIFREEFEHFMPMIIAFLEEKYQLQIDGQHSNYPYC